MDSPGQWAYADKNKKKKNLLQWWKYSIIGVVSEPGNENGKTENANSIFYF
jgi:hypothetical protein